MIRPEQRPGPDAERRFERTIGGKVRRRLRARGEGDRILLQGLGLFGMVGWSVTLPTLVGVAVGQWIDRRFPGSYSWTLMLLCIGVAVGCWNAWTWIQRQQNDEPGDD